MSYAEELKSFSKKYQYQNDSAEDADFRYVLAGKENTQTLVFLNGGMNASEMWLRYVGDLAKEYQILLLDLKEVRMLPPLNGATMVLSHLLHSEGGEFSAATKCEEVGKNSF